MRILIVHPHLTLYGGAETLLANFCACLRERGIEYKVITLSLSDSVKRHFDGTEFILPKKSFYFKLSRSGGIEDNLVVLKEIWQLRQMLTEYAPEYDLVNVHNFPASWAAFVTPRMKVWMCNEPPEFWNYPYPSLVMRMIMAAGHAFDRFIVRRTFSGNVVSDEFNSRRFKQKYGLIPAVINYGIEHEFFSKKVEASPVVEEYNLKNCFILLQVGTISYIKNQMASLKALKEIIPTISNSKMIFAGESVGAYRRKLEEFAKNYSLNNRIIFTGHITKDKLHMLYKACDVALFPTKAQGGWLSPFEALSAGKPIVVSPLLSCSEIINNLGIGVVSKNFGNTLLEMHANIKRYHEMAVKGQQWVAKNLSWGLYTSKMLDLFENVIERNQVVQK